jgi:hypothetical protein
MKTKSKTLTQDLLRKMDAYWRAAGTEFQCYFSKPLFLR